MLLFTILHYDALKYRPNLQAGKCVKIANDIFTGGETIEDAIQNFTELMKILQANNLKISASKTVLFPKQAD